ncbi:MAG: trypsin-like peptidase domain-containing protein [Clostridia bacterium]|nr:trypsin-like peptidase domain-containing protein [Clostridia bacterium]
MKHQKRNLAMTLLVALALCLSLFLTSCDFPWEVSTSIGEQDKEYDDIFDIRDELEEKPTDKPSVKPPYNVDDELPDNNYPSIDDNQDNNASSGVAHAASVGLRSVVSIYAEFGDKVGIGSGVIYDLNVVGGSAFIITNYHVVYNATYGLGENITCYLFGMESAEYAIPTTFVGGSPNYDLAVLRVEDSKIIRAAGAHGSITEARFASSDHVFPGQTAIAIGNPKMSGIAVTSGIISVDSEQISIQSSTGNGSVQMRVMRIDTAVNLGNSGGGLFDENGNIIGIVNARSSSTSIENIGYAIPSNVARAVADNIIDHCYGTDCTSVMRAMLGVTVIPASLSTRYDDSTGRIERYEEVSVYEISDGSLAKEIFEVGDLIKRVKIGYKVFDITRQFQLVDAMLDARVGDTVTFTVVRGGEEIELSTTITESCLTAY